MKSKLTCWKQELLSGIFVKALNWNPLSPSNWQLNTCSVRLTACRFLTLDFSRTAFYEITLVRLSGPLPVCSSLSFVKIRSLVFSDIVHDDCWPWYLVSLTKPKFWKKKKKNTRPDFRPKGSKSGPKRGFSPFSRAWIINFSLKNPYLTSSSEAKFWPKLDLKLGLV